MTSMVQDWVSELPLRHQGVLFSATRGCDDAPKRPYDSPERLLTSYIRYLVFNPADQRELDVPGSFMQAEPPEFDSWKQSDFGHYPVHWFAHFMHAFQVLGNHHPDPRHRAYCRAAYEKLVHGMHLRPEPAEDMERRLTEDRFAAGTVVS